MNAIQITTPIPCSHCGELRYDLTPDGQHIVPGQPEHNSARCWTIAHAYATVLEHARPGHVNDAPEWAHNVVELARWLADHPKQRGTVQYRDRETSLDRWIVKAQLIANA